MVTTFSPCQCSFYASNEPLFDAFVETFGYYFHQEDVLQSCMVLTVTGRQIQGEETGTRLQNSRNYKAKVFTTKKSTATVHCRSTACKRTMEMTSHGSADLRLVLVGQERVGKSSAGNTILRNKEFNSEDGLKLLTRSSKKAEGEVFSRRVSVVDTPGLSSSVLPPEEVKAEIQRAVELSSPGPHVFLLTIKLGRFTEQEEPGLEMLQEILGPEVSKFTMILFTHTDRLEQTGINVDQFVQEDENLQKIVQSCSGMYHVFNNKQMEDRKQVQDLLDKIDSLSDGGRRFYQRQISLITFCRWAQSWWSDWRLKLGVGFLCCWILSNIYSRLRKE
ncbi:GTPase IMAP family member 2-like isoform X1 [Poecilia formosa]|uniref:GTPase IMAP family member 2-like isoform X1 n=2 Tax=Poecilia formosa TaxID=48698 RepID=UPI0007B96B8C|nr:PREDICTED: GTPase IMAP family member 2-like isoform X1 [Poecilia formosa]